MQLRPFQDQAIADLRYLYTQGCRRALLVAPTGAGKTVIAARIIQNACDKGANVLFLAHRRELVNQCGNKLERFGVDHGIIMSGEWLQMAFEVQVASIDTLRARAMNADRMPWPRADIIVIDEAHRSLAPTYLKIIAQYPKAMVLGLTATPIRSDGKGLGHVYEGMAKCPSVAELTRMGYLVPATHFVPTLPDLTGIPIRGGDYDPKELEAALDHRQLVGDIVNHWCRLASDRPTVVFASGVKHSMHLRDEFKRYTDRVAHLDGETPLTTRREIIRDLERGYLQVVCNYGVMTEGFDEPKLSACILARATKNLGLYLQMAGRTLRPSPGKVDTRIIDHGGNWYEHGNVHDEHSWVLEEGKALEDDNKERQRNLDEKKPITCVECACSYTNQLACPNCGHIPVKKGKWVETRHGELVEARQAKRLKKREYTVAEKELWYRMLLGHAQDRKKPFHPRWAFHQFKRKFGEYPWRGIDDLPMTPNDEVKSWCRGMAIRYAKGKQKAEHKAASTG